MHLQFLNSLQYKGLGTRGGLTGRRLEDKPNKGGEGRELTAASAEARVLLLLPPRVPRLLHESFLVFSMNPWLDDDSVIQLLRSLHRSGARRRRLPSPPSSAQGRWRQDSPPSRRRRRWPGPRQILATCLCLAPASWAATSRSASSRRDGGCPGRAPVPPRRWSSKSWA